MSILQYFQMMRSVMPRMMAEMKSAIAEATTGAKAAN